jgi:ubiquinone/menaquinone biosynthesis C-methylase UbiE
MTAAKTYSHLAEVYNHMMRFIDYKMWAKYIIKISKLTKKGKKSVLEIAGGSGTLAKLLAKKFHFYVFSDRSLYMVNNSPNDVKNKISCNFLNLPFKNKFDFVFCTFDSVNYILTKANFVKMLYEVAYALTDNGVFTFDVSLEKNSLKHLKYLNRQGVANKIKYSQRSEYDPKTRIHSNQFEIILANGKKVEEIHKQKIYLFEDYFQMIEKSPFYVHGCYSAFSFNNANARSERAQFILKKKKSYANI